jgi:HD-GYP domain-containing protein (c-di-GMP phosphodiesterase class II)
MQSTPVFDHQDLLGELNNRTSISDKINYLHRLCRRNYSFVDRIAVAVYDPECDLLKTFAHSTDTGNPLPLYQARLNEAPSLKKIQAQGKPRVVNDLSVFDGSGHEHAKQIRNHGYLASYTVPLFLDSEFTGFTFFNSRRRNVFAEENLSYLDIVARLLSLLVNTDVRDVKTLRGALKTATQFTNHRDPETGAHLERMARFVRLIAREVAPAEGFDDEFVENLFWFAPLHDVGKIAIPDTILLKSGPLTAEEFDLMKTHAAKGGEILSSMLDNFRIEQCRFARMLGNIARFHHENMDGSGYPEGMQGDEIPVDARIVAVADVFDALTSDRPYKQAWDNDRAFAELRSLAGWKLDPGLVAALEKNRETVEQIQRQFRDAPL